MWEKQKLKNNKSQHKTGAFILVISWAIQHTRQFALHKSRLILGKKNIPTASSSPVASVDSSCANIWQTIPAS